MIDYSKLAHAIEYYRSHGFHYIDVPWVIDREVMEMTATPSQVIESDFGCLVGSAEQSFLQLLVDGRLSMAV